MKKKILSIIVIAVVGLIANLNLSQNNKDVKLSDLAIDNVEALAQMEENIGHYQVITSWSIDGYGRVILQRTCLNGGTQVC